ncbi:MAG: hypothetical protein CMJ31_11540 [Phycisphaerae bacterium]|nr:hypothetical protein [Phycisphaerae bacterium]
MSQEVVIERLFEALIDGDRKAAMAVVSEQFDAGVDAERMITDLLWPAYNLIDRMFRSDELTVLSNNMATRLLRVIADRVADRLEMTELPIGRSVLAFCGPTEGEELGAQMAVDILESKGFDVRFAGSNVANDELLGAMHSVQPDVLLAFCSGPCDLPALRALIDTMREIGACSETQIVVGGGVFNRAEGLAEEIGADLWADDPLELAHTMIMDPDQRAMPEQRTVGRGRKTRQAA